jgi:hypothetical protein
MAEKGIVVSDADSGESVATRDAFEQDNDSNSRVIQLSDLAFRKWSGQGAITHVTDKNLNNLSGIGSPPWNASDVLTMGDKDLILVKANLTFDHSGSSAYPAGESCVITPIIYDADGTIIGILTPKVAAPILLDKSNSSPNYYDCLHYEDSNFIGYYVTPLLSWDCHGASAVQFHVAYINFNDVTGVSLYCNAVSGLAVHKAQSYVDAEVSQVA